MVQTFHCPACNARLEYDGDDDPIVQCAFCNSAVIVPEEKRARPSTPLLPADWLPVFDNFPNMDVNNLTRWVVSLKALKQLIHNDKQQEATKLYQEKFGVSKAEAQAFVNSLTSGQGIVFSNAATFEERLIFSAMFPTASGTAGSKTKVQSLDSSNIDVGWLDVNQEISQTDRKFARNMVIILLMLIFLSMVFVLAILLVG